jgi:hypothetical protein
MNETNQIKCPSCGKEMESGTLTLGADVGPLNMILGFSIGSRGRIIWRGDSGNSIKITGKNKRIPSHRCRNCGNILFQGS